MNTIDVAERFGSAWADHDLEAVTSMLTDDCVLEAPGPAPDGVRYGGQAAVNGAWQPIFDDATTRFEVEQTIVAGDRVVKLWRYGWSDDHVRRVDVFRVRADRMAEELSYVKG